MAEAFPDVKKIRYEGPDSKNPLSFKHYNPDELVEGKSIAEHLRFSVAYWHAFRNVCADPFGQLICRVGTCHFRASAIRVSGCSVAISSSLAAPNLMLSGPPRLRNASLATATMASVISSLLS